jgi:membrane protease subunit (stomatin/prohibitin family)
VFVVIGAVAGFFAGPDMAKRRERIRRQQSTKATNQRESRSQVSISPSIDVEAELEKVKAMLDKGLIDEEEFKAMKKKIIDRS